MKTILFVDDQKDIISLYRQYATKEGYHVLWAFDGEQALEVFYNNKIDLIALDVMMPKMDGFEVVKEIRKTSMVPIIMITAKGEDFEKIMGFEIGADDYIVKPFSLKELMVRIFAMLRRIDTAKNTIIQLQELSIDPASYEVKINDKVLHVTKKEFDLLITFSSNVNRVFTREDLLNLVWGHDYIGDDRTIDAHIKRLREKCEKANLINYKISTVWGVGYKFEVNHENT